MIYIRIYQELYHLNKNKKSEVHMFLYKQSSSTAVESIMPMRDPRFLRYTFTYIQRAIILDPILPLRSTGRKTASYIIHITNLSSVTFFYGRRR